MAGGCDRAGPRSRCGASASRRRGTGRPRGASRPPSPPRNRSLATASESRMNRSDQLVEAGVELVCAAARDRRGLVGPLQHAGKGRVPWPRGPRPGRPGHLRDRRDAGGPAIASSRARRRGRGRGRPGRTGSRRPGSGPCRSRPRRPRDPVWPAPTPLHRRRRVGPRRPGGACRPPRRACRVQAWTCSQ